MYPYNSNSQRCDDHDDYDQKISSMNVPDDFSDEQRNRRTPGMRPPQGIMPEVPVRPPARPPQGIMPEVPVRPPARPPQGIMPEVPVRPPSLPPSFRPVEPRGIRIAPVVMQSCIFNFMYVWLRNGFEFWMYPTFVGLNSVFGYRYSFLGWIYTELDFSKIRSYFCNPY